MKRPVFIESVIAWVAVWSFWLGLTRDSHPTFTLALIVTTSLVIAYAIVVYLNQLWLVPLFWNNRRNVYFAILLPVMFFANGLALTVIRVSYFQIWGPDADPFGAYKHFAIDLFGMVVHLLLAVVVVRFWKRFTKPKELRN